MPIHTYQQAPAKTTTPTPTSVFQPRPWTQPAEAWQTQPQRDPATPRPRSAAASFNFGQVSVLRPASAGPDNAPRIDSRRSIPSVPVASRPTPQLKLNRTGLPDKLKAGVESLSGVSLDDVRVNYNSAKPAQLQALAYAQGNDIHLAPGQEKHLSHETWHIVQQKQGRVKPTKQMKGQVAINTETRLEKEATAMGARADSASIWRQRSEETGVSPVAPGHHIRPGSQHVERHSGQQAQKEPSGKQQAGTSGGGVIQMTQIMLPMGHTIETDDLTGDALKVLLTYLQKTAPNHPSVTQVSIELQKHSQPEWVSVSAINQPEWVKVNAISLPNITSKPSSQTKRLSADHGSRRRGIAYVGAHRQNPIFDRNSEPIAQSSTPPATEQKAEQIQTKPGSTNDEITRFLIKGFLNAYIAQTALILRKIGGKSATGYVPEQGLYKNMQPILKRNTLSKNIQALLRSPRNIRALLRYPGPVKTASLISASILGLTNLAIGGSTKGMLKEVEEQIKRRKQNK